MPIINKNKDKLFRNTNRIFLMGLSFKKIILILIQIINFVFFKFVFFAKYFDAADKLNPAFFKSSSSF